MMAHAWGGAGVPELYAQYTYVKELGLRWEDLRGPLEPWEIGLLAQMINVQTDAMERKAKVKGR